MDDMHYAVSRTSDAGEIREMQELLSSRIPDVGDSLSREKFSRDPDTRYYLVRRQGVLLGGLFSYGPTPLLVREGSELRVEDPVTRGIRIVGQLAVLPEFEGRGVATALLRRAEEEATADGAHLMLAMVDKGSPESTDAFWAARGYRRHPEIEAMTPAPVLHMPLEAGWLYQIAQFSVSSRSGRYYSRFLNPKYDLGFTEEQVREMYEKARRKSEEKLRRRMGH
ncbi:GNAT family N-acetyltransferase [Gordonia terrae]|uniref:GNAT family N-acetyltransferase n=1 Tax=Gordonia terrae TaxID=2055 RepID=UPI003F6B1773